MASDWEARAKRAEEALVSRHGGEPLALLSELDDARARLAEAERLLSELKGRNFGACPWCGGYVDNIRGKCEADCALACWLEGGGRGNAG